MNIFASTSAVSEGVDWQMVGSLADWFAAFGAIFAAAVALWIAGGERRRRKIDEQARRVAFASYAVGELGHVATIVGDIRQRIRKIYKDGSVRAQDVLSIEATSNHIDAPLVRQNIDNAGNFSREVAKAIGMAIAGIDQNARIIELVKSAANRGTFDYEHSHDVELYRFRFIDTQIWLNEAIKGMASEAKFPAPKDGGNWNLSPEELEFWKKNL